MSMQTAHTKTCYVCGENKPLEEFSLHSKMKDGHLNKCKACARVFSKAWRQGESRKIILEKDRERSNNPERVELRDMIQKRYRKNFPERSRATRALQRAVKKGLVQKYPCFVCGEDAEAHHPNYDAPLDVVWLCPSHHKQAHAMV